MHEVPLDLEDALRSKQPVRSVEDNTSRDVLPEGMQKWTSLERLSLPHFTGKRLPDWVAKFPKLKSLSVHASLQTLTPWLGSLTSLEELEIVAPEDEDLGPIAKLIRLRSLVLHGRDRAGRGPGLAAVPKSFERLKQLHELRFERTDLTDVPAFVAKLPTLQRLTFHEARLGVLAAALSSAKSLTDLSFYDTGVTALPDDIGKLQQLRTLSVVESKAAASKSRSGLSALPASIGSLRNLTELSISGSSLREVPDGVFELEELTYLILTDGALTDVSTRVFDFPALEFVNLTGNPLSVACLQKLHADPRARKKGKLPRLAGKTSKSKPVVASASAKQTTPTPKPESKPPALISRFEKALEKARPGFIKSLRGGASDAAVAKAEKKLGAELPTALRDLLAWRDGAKGKKAFYFGYHLLDLNGLLGVKKMMDELATEKPPGWWNEGWLPFLDDFSSSVVVVDTLGSYGGVKGQVLQWSRDEKIRRIYHPSFERWLESFAAGMEAGIFSQSGDGFWPRDDAKWRGICKKVSPGYPKFVDFARVAGKAKKSAKASRPPKSRAATKPSKATKAPASATKARSVAKPRKTTKSARKSK